MKLRYFSLALVVLVLIAIDVPGVTQDVSSSEIDLILQVLTSRQQTSWLDKGSAQVIRTRYQAAKTDDLYLVEQKVLEARQQYLDNPRKIVQSEEGQMLKYEAIPFNVRYDMLNEWRMTTRYNIAVDGEKFLQESENISREDSYPIPDTATYMYEYFNLDWNRGYIVAWDGEKNTTCNPGMGDAVIQAADECPSPRKLRVLQAGLLPWGFSKYSYQNLKQCPIDGRHVEVGDHTEIELTIQFSTEQTLIVRVNPDLDNVVTRYESVWPSRVTIVTCDDYFDMDGRWMPSSVTSEEYSLAANKLLRKESWAYSIVSSETPDESAFQVAIPVDAAVVYMPSIAVGPVKYHYPAKQPERLHGWLEIKARMDAGELPADNCAAAALEVVLRSLGLTLTSVEVDGLLEPDGHMVSLYNMRQALLDKGLSCKVVQTDPAALASLTNCRFIAYYPQRMHYVVLDELNSEDARIIDLTGNRIYQRLSLADFQYDWSSGIILAVTDAPFDSFNQLSEIDVDLMKSFLGGEGYRCIYFYQPEEIYYCSPPFQGSCDSYYYHYYERWQCETTPSGTCSTERLPRLRIWDCVYDSGDCTISSEPLITYYINACL